MGGKVVVVEDNDDIRMAMSELLEHEGYRTQGACNGREALALIAGHPKPDLITLDLAMPVMDGQTFIREMKKRPSCARIPVLIVSAHEPPEELPPVYAGFLRKPTSCGKLIDVVRRWVVRA